MADPDPTVWVGSWESGQLGAFFLAYLANARGTPTWYPFKYSVLDHQAGEAIAAYDAGPPYPVLVGEQARWFLDYLKRNGG